MAQGELFNIIQGIRKGDRDSCLALYQRYYQQIFKGAYQATHDQNLSIGILKAVYKKMLLAAKTGAAEDYFDFFVQRSLEEELASLPHEGASSPATESQTDFVREDRREYASASRRSRKRRKKSRRGPLYYLLNVLLWIVIAALVWAIVGLLMSLSVLPSYDLGYSWFNANLFQLF